MPIDDEARLEWTMEPPPSPTILTERTMEQAEETPVRAARVVNQGRLRFIMIRRDGSVGYAYRRREFTVKVELRGVLRYTGLFCSNGVRVRLVNENSTDMRVAKVCRQIEVNIDNSTSLEQIANYAAFAVAMDVDESFGVIPSNTFLIFRVSARRAICTVCGRDPRMLQIIPAFHGEMCHRCGNVVGCCCACQMCGGCGSWFSPNDRDNFCRICLSCIDCCSCQACPNCGVTVSEPCHICGVCPSCCNCRKCPRSRRAVDETNSCSKCGCHTEYCCCSDSKTYFDLIKSGSTGKLPVHAGKILNGMSARTVGVELEFNKINIGHAMRKGLLGVLSRWGAFGTYDGCVPNGAEIVTSPASGDAFYRQIDEICGVVNRFTLNSHCGMHVHVGADDFEWFDIRRLIYVYNCLEDKLFSIVDGSRALNHYSKRNIHLYTPLLRHTNPAEFREGLCWRMYERPSADIGSLNTQKYVECRYGGLNLHSWLMQKTFEFRQHQGVSGSARIKAWAQAMAKIVDVASDISQADMENKCDALPMWAERLTSAERLELGVE